MLSVIIVIVSFSLDTSIPFHSDRFISLHQSNGRCATNKYFQMLGKIHDIESFLHLSNQLSLNQHIFLCHWGHIALVFTWVSGLLFSIGDANNYELWVKNPIAHVPVAHGIWDPHFPKHHQSIINSYSSLPCITNFILSA